MDIAFIDLVKLHPSPDQCTTIFSPTRRTFIPVDLLPNLQHFEVTESKLNVEMSSNKVLLKRELDWYSHFEQRDEEDDYEKADDDDDDEAKTSTTQTKTSTSSKKTSATLTASVTSVSSQPINLANTITSASSMSLPPTATATTDPNISTASELFMEDQ